MAQSRSVAIRAPRFPVEMIIRLRRAGEQEWHEGRTENASRSGVLLRCNLRMEIEAPVEMGFILPAEILGSPCGEVECRGVVTRVEPNGRRESKVAVTIADYKFVREAARAKAAMSI